MNAVSRGALVLSAFLLAIGACSIHRALPPDQLYQSSESLFRQGDITSALAAADQGLAAENSWRFRLLKAKLLMSSNPKQVLEVLDSADPPAAAELRARQEMYRGRAAFYLSDFPAAHAALEQARSLAAPLDLPLLDAEIGLDRGVLAAQEGDTDAARELFRAALAAAAEHGDMFLQVRAMVSLAVLLQRTHHPDEAIYWLEKAREIAASDGLNSLLASALGNLGSSYLRLGDYEKAAQSLREAERLFARIGNRQQQQFLIGTLGTVLHETNDYRAAAEKYQQAYAMAQNIGDRTWAGWWANNLARTNIDLGDFDAAERYNREAFELKRNLPDRSDFYPRVNEAMIAAGRKDYAAAEKLYAAILAEPSDDPVLTLYAESGLADLLVKTGQTVRADAQFRSGISQVERRRAGLARDEYKLSYLSSLIDFYQRYVDFLVTRGEIEKAAEVAESSRARLLDERLNAARKSTPPLPPAAMRQLARSFGVVFLSYWLAPERSFLWVITPQGIALHVLPPEKQIAALVQDYRSFIEDLRDPLESEFPAGRKLSEILLGPIGPLLAPGTHVIVVPDRALYALNFETLPHPADAAHYLIDSVTLAAAPSLGVLAEPRPRRPPQRSILLIGNPEPAIEEYPTLPYAAQEIDRIGQSFSADHTLRLEGAQAFPAAYRAAQPAHFSWIHFAAHASANRENPLDSALILSRHDGGYELSAREVMDVALNADLVTLSACRSAGARTYSGEGLVGLSWAFLRAGARSVVAGLWDVTDLSTASLMADFYAQMVHNIAPADALREAKLRLIRSKGAYRKPFYWAPFQLYLGASLRPSS